MVITGTKAMARGGQGREDLELGGTLANFSGSVLKGTVFVLLLLCVSVCAQEKGDVAANRFLCEQPSVKPDLSNVRGVGKARLLPHVRSMLLKNGFVVIPEARMHIFQYYVAPKLPVFVTSDSVLACYGDLLRQAVRSAELEESGLSDMMRDASSKILAGLSRLEMNEKVPKEALGLCKGIFGVVVKLYDPKVMVSDDVKARVVAELQLIREASETAVSPLLGYTMDYRLFRPPLTWRPRDGTWEKDDKTNPYFQTVRFLGLAALRLKSTQETAAALILVRLEREDEAVRLLLRKLRAFAVAVGGPSDELTFESYAKLADQVFGKGWSFEDLMDSKMLARFTATARKELPDPRINSMILTAAKYADFVKHTKGFRIIPSGATFDALVLKRVCSSGVFPSGLDLFAVLGNPYASSLTDEKRGKNRKYQATMERLKAQCSANTKGACVIMHSLFDALKSLWDEGKDRKSYFMARPAWRAKQLNASLGAWAQVCHATSLYRKPNYCTLGGYEDLPGFVEPVPDFFRKLSLLAESTKTIFRGDSSEKFGELGRICGTLACLAEKELRSEPFSEKEKLFLKNFGKDIAWLHGYSWDIAPHPNRNMDVLSDVFAECQVFRKRLHAAIGPAMKILVIVNVDGEAVLTQGGVYTYHELVTAFETRLTDKHWHDMAYPGLMEWQHVYAAQEERRWFLSGLRPCPSILTANDRLYMPYDRTRNLLMKAMPDAGRFQSPESRMLSLEFLLRDKEIPLSWVESLLDNPAFPLRFRAAWHLRTKRVSKARVVFREGLSSQNREVRVKAAIGMILAGDKSLIDAGIDAAADKSIGAELRYECLRVVTLDSVWRASSSLQRARLVDLGVRAVQEPLDNVEIGRLWFYFLIKHWRNLTLGHVEKLAKSQTIWGAELICRKIRAGIVGRRYLSHIIRNPDPTVRWGALKFIASEGTPDEKREAAELLADDENKTVRELAQKLLREIRKEGAGGK